MDCLDDGRIRRYLSGAAKDEESATVRRHLRRCRACFRKATGLFLRENFDGVWNSWTAEEHGRVLNRYAELEDVEELEARREPEPVAEADVWGEPSVTSVAEEVAEEVAEAVTEEVAELAPVLASGGRGFVMEGGDAGNIVDAADVADVGDAGAAEPWLANGAGLPPLEARAGGPSVPSTGETRPRAGPGASVSVSVLVDRSRGLAAAGVANFPGRYEFRVRAAAECAPEPPPRAVSRRREPAALRRAQDGGPELVEGAAGDQGKRLSEELPRYSFENATELLGRLAKVDRPLAERPVLEVDRGAEAYADDLEAGTGNLYAASLARPAAGKGGKALEVTVDGASGKVAVKHWPAGSESSGYAFLLPRDDPEAAVQAELEHAEGKGYLSVEFDDVATGLYLLRIIPGAEAPDRPDEGPESPR